MTNEERFTSVAEAVADGFALGESSDDASLSPEDQVILANLRALASIGQAFATGGSASGDGARSVPAHLSNGATWGSLQIVQWVGRGRFGDVYRAWDPALDREVALKLVPARERDAEWSAQVVEEGRLMARVRHPNVVTIYGAQRIDGTDGMWMEFVEGRTFAAELAERGPFQSAELIHVGIELSRALDAVHAAGLVHRDVKPQNVLRDRNGRVLLGDFGTGRELADAPHAAAGLAGTPAYLAPELFARGRATPSSDLYSLGALLFHLATGRYPVEGRTLRALRDAHAMGRRASLRSLRPDFSDSLCAVIDRALDVDPAQRYQTAADLASALERCRSQPFRLARAAVAAVVALVAVTAASWAFWRAPAATKPLAPRDWVMVTAVENPAGIAYLDGTIQYALERELSRSSFFNVASRERVVDILRLMQRPLDTVLDPSTSREVALRDGEIRALVAARVDALGNTLTLSARVIAPQDGRLITAVDESAVPEDRVLEALARIGVKLRTRLGEVLPAAEQSTGLPRVTTLSFRALQLYAQALSLQDDEGRFAGKEQVAERLLQEAIKDDAQFGAALHLLATVVRLDGERRRAPRTDEALRYAERAVVVSQSASPAERIRYEGVLHALRYLVHPVGPNNKGYFDNALASCEALLQLDPNDVSALMDCSSLYGIRDQPHAAFATRLAALRPNNAVLQLRAARALLALKPPQRDDARRYIARAETLPMTDDGGLFFELGKVRFFEVEEAWLARDARAAQAALDRIFADSRAFPSRGAEEFAVGSARAYLTLGQLGRAESVAASANPVAQPNLLTTILVRGAPARLRAHLRKRPIEEVTGITSALIEAEMLPEAHEAIRLLSTRPLMTRDYVLMAEGQLAVAERRYEDAVNAFEEQLRLTPPNDSVMRVWRALDKLGLALAATGRTEKGIALLEAAPPLDAKSSVALGWGFEWIAMRDRLAQLYRQAHRLADAERVESDLLRLLAVADADHPVKRRLMHFAASTPASRQVRK